MVSLVGVVPIPVEIEVAVKPTPREFSGLLNGETADEDHCRKKRLREVGPATQHTLAEVIRADLHELVISAGTAALAAVLEHERTRLVGPRYAHLPGRHAHRTGSVPGELVMGGRCVQVRRPRTRTVDGHEVELPTWAAFGGPRWCARSRITRTRRPVLRASRSRRDARPLVSRPGRT